jgi:hypothetical protein
MISIRSVKLTAEQATALETERQTRMDMDHSAQASQLAPCPNSTRGHLV